MSGLGSHVDSLRRQLTPARWKGLQVLAQTGEARVSNITTTLPPTVYWQTARWLVDHGLATGLRDARLAIRITTTGRRLREVADR